MHRSTTTIVVGGDTTPAATAALRWAVQQADHAPRARVVVVHAFDLAHRADLALERDVDRARRDARYRTQSWVVETLGVARRQSDGTVPVSVRTPDGGVEEALAAAARQADLLVVGAPRSEEHRLLPARLAARCACPVVTVTPDQAGCSVRPRGTSLLSSAT